MQQPPQAVARRSFARTAQIAALLSLLAVFVWRTRSCQVQIEEKRRAAAQHEARFSARTASEPSPLPLDPYARRAAMADALRLRPDRRFLLAAAQIRQLTGSAASPAEARFEGGKWKLSAGADSLGDLPELPDYPELMRPLVALAQRQLLAAPLQGAVGAGSDEALQWEPDARATLPAQLARWNGGQRTAATLHLAARAAAALCFYQVDALETNDALAARAIALVALDIAAGQAQTAGEQAVLASALGYTSAARELGTHLGRDSSLRYFLAGDDARLREHAFLREAGASDRYLRLRRALQRNDEDDANKFLDSYQGTERLDLAVLILLLRERRMEHFAPVAFALPVFVLAAAAGVPVRAPTQDRESDTVRAALVSTATVLHLESGSLSQRLEEALSKGDADVGGYLRAAWLSALRRQGEYLADAQGNRDSTARFVEGLAKDPAPTVQLFHRWFAARASLGSGNAGEALSAIEKQHDVGGLAVAGILEQAEKRADFSDPKLLRDVRALMPWVDARVSHRIGPGGIALSPLQDLGASETLLRSAFQAAPDGHQQLQEWFADLAGDARELESIGRDRFALRYVRNSAWEHLWNLGGGHAAAAEQGLRGMLDEDPKDDMTAYTLGQQLRLAGRLDDARAVLLAWLRPNDVPGVRAANVRGTLARYSFLAGRYDEGLAMVSPALQIGNARAYQYAALNLAGKGLAVEARQMVDTLLKRYPYAKDVAIAAEVEWQLGDIDAAAKRLASAPTRLTATDYRKEVSEGFIRICGEQPDRAAAAIVAAARAGVDAENLTQLAYALDERGRSEAAFRVLDAIPAQGDRADFIRLSAARPLRKARGDEAARSWLRQQFPNIGEDRGRHLALIAFREGAPEMVWEVVPDPKGTDDYAETTWMLRAAQSALQGETAPRERKQALHDHYASVRQPTRHTQIGRYLIGEVPEAEVAKLVTDLPGTCEVPYYFGVRAQGEKRFGDAADWYRVAVECGMRQEAEYLFAWNELYRFRGKKDVFARLRSTTR